MRVLFLIRSLEVGGAERQLIVLTGGLRRRGVDVKVLKFYEGGPLEAQLGAAGVPVRTVGKRGRWDVTRFISRLVAIVREENPDVFHSYLVDANVVAALARPAMPRATRVVWGLRDGQRDLTGYDPFIRSMRHVQLALAHVPDLVIANSQAGAEHYRRTGFPADRMRVIPNGIDAVRFHPDPAARARVRAELGLAEGMIAVGLVGRLDPVKDHPTFLAGAALAARARPELRFLCVGDGPAEYGAALAGRAAELGIADRVIFTGNRNDTDAVQAALDVACSCSVSEGFSNTIAEAMASGVPCVVSDVGDSAMIVADTGHVFRPGDAEGLAEGIDALCATVGGPGGAARREATRARIVERFGVERLIDRTQAELEALA